MCTDSQWNDQQDYNIIKCLFVRFHVNLGTILYN